MGEGALARHVVSRRGTPVAGRREWGAVLLLPFGSLLFPVLGWLLGVVFLWTSRVWSTREKVAGTLLVPGGLSLILYVALIAGSSSCTTGGGRHRTVVQSCTSLGLPPALAIALLVGFAAGGIAMPVLLTRRALATRRP